MLRHEPYKLLFPLGTLLGWLGVLPWLFFALGLRRAYEPIYATLAYRSFLHPLVELEGFWACFAVGLLFTLLPRATGTAPPARWQLAVAIVAPIVSALLGALGRWEIGQIATLALAVVAMEFCVRRIRLTPSALYVAAGLAMGAAGAGLAQFALRRGADFFWMHEMGRDLVMQGLFMAIAIGIGRMLRGGERPARPSSYLFHALGCALFAASFPIGARFGQHLGFALRAIVAGFAARPLRPEWEFGPANLRRGFAHLSLWLLPLANGWIAISLSVRRAGLHVIFLGCLGALLMAAFTQVRQGLRLLAFAAAFLALSMVARVMVELDPSYFHLWMGISAASFLTATVLCWRVPIGAQSV